MSVMTLSMHQAASAQFLRQLGALSAMLDIAEAFARDNDLRPGALTEARLAPDMFPLTRQVQIACDMAKGCMARLAGREVPSWADEESSFADLKGTDVDQEMTGQPYLLHFVLPNFFFHVTAAYAILRHKGVPLTKQDYMGAI